MASLAKLRTRWAAIGAACAVTLGGGTLGIVQASVSSGDRAVYVPITPVRVLDTRSDVGVATVQDAIPALLTVTGNIATTTGQQNVVPTGASSVVINVTAINPTSDGFVSLRPGDATGEPAVSTLNVTVGGTFPNGATITLPTSGGSAGQIQIWYEAYAANGGTTDLLIDVVGYYADHDHDDRYYTETEVDTALTDKANIQSLLPPNVPSAPITIDSNGLVGFYSTIAIGMNGNPIIGYQDGTNRDLKVATCTSPACTSATTSTLDSANESGGYISLAIGANGNPIIAYLEYANRDLKVAACQDPKCETAIVSTIDTGDGNQVGFYTSITIGLDGNPIISYRDNSNGVLKVAACSNADCTDSTISIIDSNGGSGYFTSIAIASNGFPIISYSDSVLLDLKVAACEDFICSTATISTLDYAGNVGAYNSIAIGTTGFPIISYYDESNTALKVAICQDPICSSSSLVALDSTGSVGKNTSLAIGLNGNPIISYYDDTNGQLKMASCFDLLCTQSAKSAIDVGGVGSDDSIAIGIDGNPIISYLDFINRDLKVVSPWWVVGGR